MGFEGRVKDDTVHSTVKVTTVNWAAVPESAVKVPKRECVPGALSAAVGEMVRVVPSYEIQE